MDHLFPDHLFQAIPSVWLLMVVIAFSIYGLGKGADWLIDGAVSFARRLGVTPITPSAKSFLRKINNSEGRA